MDILKTEHEMLREIIDTIWFDTWIGWDEEQGIFYLNDCKGNKEQIDARIIVFDCRFWKKIKYYVQGDIYSFYWNEIMWENMEQHLNSPVRYLYNGLELKPRQ